MWLHFYSQGLKIGLWIKSWVWLTRVFINKFQCKWVSVLKTILMCHHFMFIVYCVTWKKPKNKNNNKITGRRYFCYYYYFLCFAQNVKIKVDHPSVYRSKVYEVTKWNRINVSLYIDIFPTKTLLCCTIT